MLVNYETNNYHPSKAYHADAAWDLSASEDTIIPPKGWNVVPTGLRIGLPKGYVGFVLSRSGLATRGIFVLNSPGVVDSGYTGEVKVILANMMDLNEYAVKSGDRIAQLMIVKTEDVRLNPGTVWGNMRGDNGFGSTGLDPEF